MTIYTGSGDLPHHQYVHVDRIYLYRNLSGFEPALWFGLTARYGEMWGCHLLLKSGAVYRNAPPHALSFMPKPVAKSWTRADAQMWDCYGPQFSTIEYRYLQGLRTEIKIGEGDKRGSMMGAYLFTVVPLFDGYTRAPDQSKEFMFMALDNGRLAIRPTDKVLFHDKSFTEPAWPTGLRRQTETYHCED